MSEHTNGSTWEELGRILGPISWAWRPWLPNGLLTMVIADQQQGKSMLLLRIAACFLRGDPWPDGTPYTGETGRVLWCEAESSQGLNYTRAAAWGLPVANIISPLGDPLDDVLLDDADHLRAIQYWAHERDTRVVLVDSLTGASRRDLNDSRAFHTVKTIADLARDSGKPAMLSHHTRKLTLLDQRGIVTLEQGRGSGAIPQPARCVWAIDTPDPNDDETRRLALLKNNVLGKRAAEPLGFTIDGDGLTFCEPPQRPIIEGQAEKATRLLLGLLASGPRRATDLQAEFDQAGVSWRTAKRAKDSLGVVSKRRSDGWYWGLGDFSNE